MGDANIVGEEYRGHVLVVPYPSQGHINPMLQFAKRLASKAPDVRATLTITNFISTTMKPRPPPSIHLETISDGFDAGGFSEADSIHSYLSNLKSAGSKTLSDLIIKYQKTSYPVTCIIYDSFLPWALEVAKKFELHSAVFFTQTCAVSYIYYLVYHGQLKMPVTSLPLTVPGLPVLELRDVPSYLYMVESYPAYAEMILQQFQDVDTADFILVNTFYKLEAEVVDTMSKVCPLITIGPTIPSVYLDKRGDDDGDYGLHLFDLHPHDEVTAWLQAKPPRSVAFVSFGSMAALSTEQMEEIAWGLYDSGCSFLWVVRASEESKIPEKFKEELPAEQGLLVRWSRQLDVLSNDRIGCFLSHCGWNSTLEALSMGVPIVATPQWTDQMTNAKLLEDVWKVGVRVRVEEDGMVRRGEVERCMKEVMQSERGRELAENARKWRELAVEAVSEGGTSDENIDDFLSTVVLKTN